ncbi:pilus assembly protein [Rhodococcus hoagii]|nr:pilus assembly protein [Prescottella equi]NKS71710.1 pilus assembly protein [Prescottella equi]
MSLTLNARRTQRRATRSTPCRNDAGSAAIQWAILLPIILLLTFGLIQGALYYHARNVALVAAEQGLDATRGQYGTTALGYAAAESFLTTAGTTLEAPTVTITRGTTEATISVVGKSTAILPFLDFTVSVDRSLPIERITTPGER